MLDPSPLRRPMQVIGECLICRGPKFHLGEQHGDSCPGNPLFASFLLTRKRLQLASVFMLRLVGELHEVHVTGKARWQRILEAEFILRDAIASGRIGRKRGQA
jgi:hypothetical protein